jgi:hypothetical protein
MKASAVERDCSGHEYSKAPGRAKSSHYCPKGKRSLCEECATNGKGHCPKHRVKVNF